MERREDLALLMTLEMGKPLSESRGEVSYAAEYLRWFAEEAVRVDGRYGVAPDGSSRMLVTKVPVGPCLLITPWNFPLAMGTRKIGPAVAAGCTMVVKPAQQTPLSMLALAEILGESGLPDGVLNVITSSSASRVMDPLVADPRSRKLSFTGSTSVGRRLAENSARGLMRVSMELGGNAPFLVFEDADIDAAVEGGILAKLRNGGEACTAANRFYVHEAIAEEFANRFAAHVGAMRVGPGIESGSQVGPLIDSVQRDKVHQLVTEARDRGSVPLIGGRPVDGPGYFYEPTVLADVPPDAQLLDEEIFGPVAPAGDVRRTRTRRSRQRTTPSTDWSPTSTRRMRPRVPRGRAPRDRDGRPQPRPCRTPPRRSAGSRPRGTAARAVARASTSTSSTKYIAIDRV